VLTVTEPEEQTFFLKNFIFYKFLESGGRLLHLLGFFPGFLGWKKIKTNTKTRKINSKHVSSGDRARRARIFSEKNA
jgi:hypothetical protein